jgi:hypothetical protein
MTDAPMLTPCSIHMPQFMQAAAFSKRPGSKRPGWPSAASHVHHAQQKRVS